MMLNQEINVEYLIIGSLGVQIASLTTPQASNKAILKPLLMISKLLLCKTSENYVVVLTTYVCVVI